MRDWRWSHTEKAAARRAFDLAFDREVAVRIEETKRRAAQISEASDVWKLERWLNGRRREIDNRFDYRYSVVPLVFAAMLRDGLLTEDDLRGLAPDKIHAIRETASILVRD